MELDPVRGHAGLPVDLVPKAHAADHDLCRCRSWAAVGAPSPIGPARATGRSRSGGGFLPEHTTAVSLLDRLVHQAVVVVTGGESFRMKGARSRGGGRRT